VKISNLDGNAPADVAAHTRRAVAVYVFVWTVLSVITSTVNLKRLVLSSVDHPYSII